MCPQSSQFFHGDRGRGPADAGGGDADAGAVQRAGIGGELPALCHLLCVFKIGRDPRNTVRIAGEKDIVSDVLRGALNVKLTFCHRELLSESVAYPIIRHTS